ncbi:Armadillo [Macleaya cordata]|uniref:RING-type E3 ubiquitin transferase n=1 Tax=Macleaya cordata TaxID=56857 RepID=A0A200Q9D1_MACCD|nr:Armadillo [Macleaya cordata]
MENDAAKGPHELPYSCGIKVHRLMCIELSEFVDRISKIFPAIESAQPRCSSGIEALCSLNIAMEKAKSLIQHCTECSKLYLAITGNTIILRCERVRNALEESLCQIQNMVPLLLAAQISGIVDDLRDAKFSMESSDEKAGKVVLSLLRQASDSTEAAELEAFQIAALSLRITSQKALLIEKRSIKKLLDKVRSTDQTKERILNYLLYLLMKYGKLIRVEQTGNASAQCEDSCSITNSVQNNAVCDESIEPEPVVGHKQSEVRTNSSSKLVPPEEFRCPISLRLMHDPVIIASGQTFERVWIEKWFSDGHDTCPKTQRQLPHLSIIPNSAMKDIILKWCRKHGISIPNPCSQPIPAAILSWKSSSSSSITSLGSSLNDLCVPTRIDVSCVSVGSSDASWGSDFPQSKIVDSLSLGSAQMNDGCHTHQSSANICEGVNSSFLSEFTAIPWESQCKAMGDVKNHLKDNNQACYSMLSDNLFDSLIQFLKEARERCDVEAQRVGAQVLLAFVSKSGSGLPSLYEDLFHLLASFLDSEIAEEALAIMQVLSCDEYCKSKVVDAGALPSILRILDSQIRELYAPAVKILHNLTSNSNIRSHILQMECIPRLISFLSDSSLAEYCVKILNDLCNTEEGRIAVAEANGCIASITELLETGTHEQQEHSLAVLLSLCSHQFEYCLLVLKEGVIPPLVNISVNGNTKGKENAIQLLRLLRDIRHNDSLENSLPSAESRPELPSVLSTHSTEKQSYSKASGFFGRRLRIFTKPRSLALV